MIEPTEPLPAEGLGELRRVRHQNGRRMLTVSSVETLTPRMRRIVFQSAQLADFTSLSFDDHIKLFLIGADGAPIMRDYTPRYFDARAGTLTIDFALHEAGPATAWAMTAATGDRLEIGGPRGSAIIAPTYDWHLLIGDETALPAIGRRVEELPAGARVTTVVAVDGYDDIQTFRTDARWTGEWLRRDRLGKDDAANVGHALERLFPSRGDGFVWIAGEAQFARALRGHVAARHGQPLQRIKASGYWVRGGEVDQATAG